MLKYNEERDAHQCECGHFIDQMELFTIEKWNIDDDDIWCHEEPKGIEYTVEAQAMVKSWLECPCGRIYQQGHEFVWEEGAGFLVVYLEGGEKHI